MKLFNLFIFLSLIFLCTKTVLAQDTLLSVQDAIRIGIENNFDVRISKNEIEIGSINNDWAMAGALPVVSASANKTIGTNNLKQKLNNGTVTEKKGTNTQNFNMGLAVNWQVFDGLKMFATKKKLEELERLGEHAFRKSINETVFGIINSYYNIVKLKEQHLATIEQIGLFNQRLELAQRRLENGTGAKYEVLEAEVDLNEQRSNLIILQNAINTSKSDLFNLMGRKADTSYLVADSILVKPLPELDEVNRKIDAQNPDILMANSNLIVLQQTRKEVNAGRLPVANLNAFYNFNKSSNSAGFNLFNQTYGPSGSLGISVPVFNGGIVKKQLQVTDIQIRNQQLQTQKLRNDIDAAVNNAYINYYSALKSIELETNNLKLASENIFIATERYKKLNITAVELRQIQISYYDAKNRLYNALLQAKSAEATIALLTGDIGNL